MRCRVQLSSRLQGRLSSDLWSIIAAVYFANTCFAGAGAKYSQYCGIVARTYLIDPNKQQEQEYAALVAAMEAAVKALRPGAPCSDAYAAAVKALEVRPTPPLHGLKSG